MCALLDKREAIARMSHRHPKPFLFEVPSVAVDKHVDWHVLEHMMQPRLASLHTTTSYTPPRPKASRPQGPSVSDATKVKQLLFDVYNTPFEPVSGRYRRLFGSSGGLGNRVKNLALQWQYANEIKIHTGDRSGVKVFLEISAQGYRLIGMPQQQRRGIGDFEHQYWQHRIDEAYRQRGYSPTKELQVRGKRVDVGLRSPKFIAFEVATTPSNELSNVRKDLQAGFELVVICATNKKVQSQVESLLMKHLNAKDWVHVEVCLIQEYLQRTAWF